MLVLIAEYHKSQAAAIVQFEGLKTRPQIAFF